MLGRKSDVLGRPKTGLSDKKQKPLTNVGCLPVTKGGFAGRQVQEVQEVQVVFGFVAEDGVQRKGFFGGRSVKIGQQMLFWC